MNGFGRIFGLAIGAILTLGLIGLLVSIGGKLGLVLFIEVILGFYGYALYAYFSYREARQEELRSVLALAVAAKSSLGGAVWAYAEDRPRGWFRRFFEGLAANLLVLGSYWTWQKRHRFDRRVADLATHLDYGAPLSEALAACPGTANAETMLAAAVGETTGNLAQSLREASQARLAPVILKVMPRLIYPLVIVFVTIGVVTFQAVNIVPKFEAIANGFHIHLSDFVKSGFAVARGISTYIAPLAVFFALALIWIGPALIVSPGFRWRMPGVGWIERRMCQGRILKMLGLLLSAGKTVPESLQLLCTENYLGVDAQNCVGQAYAGVIAGRPLADELAASRLLPANMIPLLKSAERAQNLPWALQEAGDTIIRRVHQIVHRFTAVVGPISIALLGGIAAFAGLCVFLPLIDFLTEMTPK